MVDHYRSGRTPEEALDCVEDEVFESPSPTLIRAILDQKRSVGSLRRITIPQRDVIGRLARREFVDISSEMAYRFRDVYDQLVRLNDEAFIFSDRITGILEAHLSSTSNQLNR
jgi:magnesium transporter